MVTIPRPWSIRMWLQKTRWELKALWTRFNLIETRMAVCNILHTVIQLNVQIIHYIPRAISSYSSCDINTI